MMAPMGKGTRAAGNGNRRRAAEPAPAPGQPQGRPAGYGQDRAQAQPPGAPGAAGQGRGPVQPPAPPRAAERPRSGRGATFSVAMMTLVALTAVGVLAAQAEATAPKVRAGSSNASTSKSTGTKSGTSTSTGSTALPANSGSGTRIVYSPGSHRVWLVENSTVERTMTVVPGTVNAPTGSYTVYGKSPGSIGGDGVTVLYVVKFDSASSTTFGFDAEAGVNGLPAAPTGRTGGIRMTQLDAQLLYEFASVGTAVVVV